MFHITFVHSRTRESPEIIVIKVTKTAPRINDPYDVPIKNYKEAGLRFPSTASVAKIIIINQSQVLHKIGKIHPEDLEVILEKLNHLTDST